MLPEDLISSLHGQAGFDETDFRRVHVEALPPVSVRIHPEKWRKAHANEFPSGLQVPWCKTGFFLPERPVFTLDPLLHAGAYYVQEASSMFLEQAIRKATKEDTPVRVLDLCAAPGGKSTHLLSTLPKGSVLVCNEVIQGRVNILLENLVKWGSADVIVTQNDPADFGRLGPLFDGMVVDAPCSGSGLFRRDPEATKEWSLQAVEMCGRRQQRILADALPCLKPGGFLIYSTCSYSPREDETIVDMLATDHGFEGVELDWPNGFHGVVKTITPVSGIPCYRFYPDRVQGEGFFIAMMRKPSEAYDEFGEPTFQKIKEQPFPPELNGWVTDTQANRVYQNKESCYLMPGEVYKLFHHLRGELNIRKAGVKMAEQVHRQFIPVHDFALSELIDIENFPFFEASEKEALTYLRRDDLQLADDLPKGWLLVTYKGVGLGWLKNLGNRFNNYYPKEWRIKMQIPKL